MPPVPADVVHIVFRAELHEQPETFSDIAVWGFYAQRRHYPGNTVDWPNDVQFIAEGVRDRWVENVTNKGDFSSAVVGDTVQCVHLNSSTGKTQDVGQATFRPDHTWNGTASGGLPWETSVGVTFWGYEQGTFTPHKERKRGRMYLPPMAAAVMDTYNGKLSSAAQDRIADAMEAFFNDVQGMELPGETTGASADYLNVGVLSRFDNAMYETLQVGVGNVVDSQRRRRNRQTELYLNRDIARSE